MMRGTEGYAVGIVLEGYHFAWRGAVAVGGRERWEQRVLDSILLPFFDSKSLSTLNHSPNNNTSLSLSLSLSSIFIFIFIFCQNSLSSLDCLNVAKCLLQSSHPS